MNILPISAIILTKNEAHNIGACLRSIAWWVDEIFVVDSYSEDDTLRIARDFTDKVSQHPFESFAQQRNWAQDNLPLRNDWVLHLDADERVSLQLAAELKREFSRGPAADGFMAPRKTVFRNKWIKHGGHYPVYHLRVFKKSKGRSEERLYDQHYMVKGSIIRLNGDITNIINPDLLRWKTLHKEWARLEAQEATRKDKSVLNMGLSGNPIARRNWMRYKVYYRMPLFVRCLLYFFYRYFLRLGFLDGLQGWRFHFFQGLWYRVLVDINILKMNLSKVMAWSCLNNHDSAKHAP